MLTSKGYHITVNNTKPEKVFIINGIRLKAQCMKAAFAEYESRVGLGCFYESLIAEAEPVNPN